MAKEYKDLVVGLDIGTSKIMVVVAEVTTEGQLKLAGLGVAPSNGLKRGVVIYRGRKRVRLTADVDAIPWDEIRAGGTP